MRGAIFQPTYLPWMGYFDAIAGADTYVAADHLQFNRRSWQKRNRIKTPEGTMWLNLPVQKEPIETPIHRVRISYNHGNPLKKHWKLIEQAYRKAPFFAEYRGTFEAIFSREFTLLRDLNLAIIRAVLGILALSPTVVLSSELGLHDEPMDTVDRAVYLCQRTGITELVEGAAGRSFMDPDRFAQAGITLRFHEYEHPVYPQLYGEFVPYLSVIDLLFNVGPASLDVILQGRRPPRESDPRNNV